MRSIFPGLGRGFFCRGFFRPERTLRRRATLTLVATSYLEDAATLRMPLRIGCGRVHTCRHPTRWLGRSVLDPLILEPLILEPLILGRSILASRRETDLANG